jgi:hypothetical protein
VIRDGIAVNRAQIARVWTPQHEALLRSAPPPATLAESRARDAALVAESAGRGFGPGTPLEQKIAEAGRLGGLGVAKAAIGKHLGVSGERVRQ